MGEFEVGVDVMVGKAVLVLVGAAVFVLVGTAVFVLVAASGGSVGELVLVGAAGW